MSEFILQIEKLLSAFGDPEYRYLALEPLIPYGLLAGVLMLVVGYFAKISKLEVAALVVIGSAALLHFPYKDARLAAEPRLERVYKVDAPSRAADFSKNTKDWLAHSWQFRLLVLCAFGTLLIGIHRNRIGFGLSILTVLLGLVAMKNAMWLNYQDALAYHPNLKKHEVPIDRGGPAPASSRVPASRTPSIPVAQPIVPAAQTLPPPAAERIQPPAVPVTKKSRKVEPIVRY